MIWYFRYPRILVVISHSQDFLNGVCTNIIHMHQKKLKYFGVSIFHLSLWYRHHLFCHMAIVLSPPVLPNGHSTVTICPATWPLYCHHLSCQMVIVPSPSVLPNVLSCHNLRPSNTIYLGLPLPLLPLISLIVMFWWCGQRVIFVFFLCLSSNFVSFFQVVIVSYLG